MSDDIIAKFVKVIAYHEDIENEPEPTQRLLSEMAPHIFEWLSDHRTEEWQPKHVKNFMFLYKKGNFNGNEMMARTLLSRAMSARAYESAILMQQIVDHEEEAKSAKKDKEAHVNYMCETAFHCAAKDGDTDEVKKLLDNPEFDGNDADEIGMTPLHHAAKYGHSAVVKLLLDNTRIDRNSVDKSGMTSLHHATKYGHTAVVKLLLADDKVEMTMEDCQGNTPLMLAVVHGATADQSHEETPYFDILEMMLDKIPLVGIHAFNHQHHTPFSWAKKTRQIGVMSMFIERQQLSTSRSQVK